MSNPEGSDRAYTLSIDELGARVAVRSEASVALFTEIMQALVTGFHRLSLEELGRIATLSRRSRRPACRYRVSLVTRRDPDFGVGRMLQGRVSERGPLQLGVFRRQEEAERWAFGPVQS